MKPLDTPDQNPNKPEDFLPAGSQCETPITDGSLQDHRELCYDMCVPADVSRMFEKEARMLREERETVHKWLTDKGVPDTEATGLKMCLLRRLAVALGVQPHVC